MRTRHVVLSLLIALACTAPLGAQSFLGAIRGTVVDPQGGAVKGAAVLITDEATNTPRSVDTDAEGRYEAPNIKPGLYRVEVITPNFKKFEKTSVLVSASGTALVDVTLEVGGVSETVTVSGEANNITLESQAITRGLDEQQLHDLPRSSRDIQSFLLLNPNVVGGSGDTDIQFLGAKTYGVSYIQDGQASTNAIFGTVGNSAPGLDAISEVQVLSNSYSAEYGGLAGVVVTTKRGTLQFHGTGFYDFNNNGLNALTYNQTLAGVERDDPLSDTHEHRWGGSLGGPLFGSKLFFYGNYEGSNDKAIYGGARANVPTQAMRGGDFRGTSVHPNDPLTGEPFADQMIPPERIDSSATKIMNFFYPLPNQGVNQATGYGVFQQFVPETRKRQRFDIRLDSEATKNDSLFFRSSYQHRDPSSIRFEAGNALTNMPILDQHLNTGSVIGGWTRILSPAMVNELRGGFNHDNSTGQSNFVAGEVSSQLGIEVAPSKANSFGFPTFQFNGTGSRPLNIADQQRNVDRTVQQDAFSISDNLSWLKGAHSMKFGGLYTRNTARDGFGIGVNNRGLYRFNGSQTGNAFTDFMLGLPNDARDQVTSRGPLDGHSTDFAVFGQDDWKVGKNLTVFLGLRYEIVGIWHESSDLVANFITTDGGHHVVPNDDVAAKLPPGLIELNRTLTASEAGLPDTLLNVDKNNFSPRVGFSWRLDEANKNVLRGGFGLFHPTVAVQGIRDLLATNEFRYTTAWAGGDLQHAFSEGEPFTDPGGLRQPGHRPEPAGPQHLPVQPDLRARDGRHGPARQLHRLDDAEAARGPRLQHDAGQHGAVRQRQPRRPGTAAVRSLRAVHGHRPEHGQRAVPQHAARAVAPLEARPGVRRGVHAGALRQQRTRHGQQHHRAGAIRSVRHREGPRSRSQRGQAPPDGERHVGHPLRARAQARREHVAVGQRPVRRLDGLDDRAGAERPEPHAVLQLLLHDEPVEYREAA